MNKDIMTTGSLPMDLTAMSDDQLAFLSDLSGRERMTRMERELTRVKSDQNMIAQRLQDSEEEIRNQNERLEKQEKLTNVIGFGVHSHKYKKLRNACIARVYSLLNNSSSVEFIVWSRYFFRRIHIDIANRFGVDTCRNINVDMFGDALTMASSWRPTDWYVAEKIEEMRKKRDVGLLKPERCLAISVYLESTKNGTVNPF